MAHDEALEALRRKIALAEGVAEHSAGLLEQARAEAAERAADAEHAAEERQAQADLKLVREVDALSAKLADKLAELEASRKRTGAANDRRGARPFIADAEERVRRRAGDMVPARVDEYETWVDAHGNPVRDQILNDQGRYVWNPAAKERKTVRQVVSEAYQLPPKMPRRLADEIRLVDLEGRVIWGR